MLDIQTEFAARATELAWIYSNLNQTYIQIKTALKEGLDACEGQFGSIAISSPNSDALKGFVALSSTTVAKGELNVKLLKSSGTPITVKICAPFKLFQLVKTRNCLVAALNLLPATTLHTFASSSFQAPSPQKAVLQHILDMCRKGRQALQSPTSLENSIPTYTQQCNEPSKRTNATPCFTPLLPDDYMIEFTISNTLLKTCIYHIVSSHLPLILPLVFQHATQLKNPVKIEYYGQSHFPRSSAPLSLMSKSHSNSTMHAPDRTVVVCVESHSPKLILVMKALNTVCYLCNDMITKIDALS